LQAGTVDSQSRGPIADNDVSPKKWVLLASRAAGGLLFPEQLFDKGLAPEAPVTLGRLFGPLRNVCRVALEASHAAPSRAWRD
jgi:hypothetical protein